MRLPGRCAAAQAVSLAWKIRRASHAKCSRVGQPHLIRDASTLALPQARLRVLTLGQLLPDLVEQLGLGKRLGDQVVAVVPRIEAVPFGDVAEIAGHEQDAK